MFEAKGGGVPRRKKGGKEKRMIFWKGISTGLKGEKIHHELEVETRGDALPFYLGGGGGEKLLREE